MAVRTHVISRSLRVLALLPALVLTVVGGSSNPGAMAPREHQVSAIPVGVFVGSAALTLPPAEIEPEPEPKVVQVPASLTLKQARALWEREGSPSPDDIAAASPFAGAQSDTIDDFARNFVGAPYVFSGSTPRGFDCSGYIRFVYAHYGVLLPHGVRAQGDAGIKIKQSKARPGDLVIWNDRSHSAIYAGNGMILHATSPGGRVSEVALYTDNVFYVRIPVGTTTSSPR